MASAAESQDPKVAAVGFDITEMAPPDMLDAGILIGRQSIDRDELGDAYASHAAIDSGSEKQIEMDRQYARLAVADWRARGREGLRGLRLLRPFPCTGVVRHLKADARLVLCDLCGAEWALPEKPEGSSEPEAEQAEKKTQAEADAAKWSSQQDDIPF